MLMTDWDQAKAEYTLTIKSSIACFEASGTLTRKSAMAAMQGFFKAYPEERPEVTGIIVMYDRCEMQVTLGDMMAIYQDILANGLPIETPMALVVPQWIYGVIKEYCGLQRHAGVIREAFLRRELAMEWVEQQAALFELQRKARRA